jgi:hypothetical protein
MSENEGGDSRFMTGFLVGFVVGVLVCLGAGGSYFMVARQHQAAASAEMERARMDAVRAEEMARKEAEAARALADAEAKARRRAEEAEKDKGKK